MINNNSTSIQNINNKLSKYSINNIFLYQISKQENFELNNNNISTVIIFNFELIDDFKKDSILEINSSLLFDYLSYNDIGRIRNIYNFFDVDNNLINKYVSLKTSSGDNAYEKLFDNSFFIKLNDDYQLIKIQLELFIIEGITNTVKFSLINTYKSNYLAIKYYQYNNI